MTDIEYDIIDECYFVVKFDELLRRLSLPQEILSGEIKNLYLKGWIRCYKDISEEVYPEGTEFDKDFMNYYYLASKEGLKAHNAL